MNCNFRQNLIFWEQFNWGSSVVPSEKPAEISSKNPFRISPEILSVISSGIVLKIAPGNLPEISTP